MNELFEQAGIAAAGNAAPPPPLQLVQQHSQSSVMLSLPNLQGPLASQFHAATTLATVVPVEQVMHPTIQGLALAGHSSQSMMQNASNPTASSSVVSFGNQQYPGMPSGAHSGPSGGLAVLKRDKKRLAAATNSQSGKKMKSAGSHPFNMHSSDKGKGPKRLTLTSLNLIVCL